MVDETTRRAMARDPMAYGVKASRKVLETITQYVHEQGLTARRVGVEELFAPSTIDL
jgi:4,5-dihydroxyphthalate decarboxylase